MRLRSVLLALAVAGLAWSAQAQTDSGQADPAQAAAPADQLDLPAARAEYEAGLAQQCPEKGLQMLSARGLSDGLDEFKSGLPADARDQLVKAEVANCSTADAGASCANFADIAAAGALGRMDELVTSICTSFLRCRDQGQCDYAR
jgi:hypothetical protein